VCGAAFVHVREGGEAPRARTEDHGGQRGGVERAERERVAGLARFLAWDHFDRVAHLLTRKVTIQMGGSEKHGGQRGNGCEEKHSNTTVHHPVVKPPATASTAMWHTPTDTTGLGKLPGTIL